jgi:3',5'-cyclic AMP phosphodiesterase CpdA
MISFFSFPQDEKNESFKVAFLTDIHVQKELNAERGFLSAINKVNEMNPDLVITGGDLIMDALNQSYERSDSLFNLYDSLCDSFNMPVYNTIGNHDVFGLYKTSGIDTTHHEYGKKMYINRLGDGKSYSSFDHKGWHFILLDAIEFTPERKYIGGISQSQIDWIKKDLTRLDKKTPIVLSTHIPFISVSKQILEGSTAALTEVIVVKNSKEILALFEGYNLKLVLQGHLHIVEEIIFKETHFITGGAVSGNWWKGSHYGFEEGFVIIEFYEDDFNWKYIDYGWEVKETK